MEIRRFASKGFALTAIAVALGAASPVAAHAAPATVFAKHTSLPDGTSNWEFELRVLVRDARQPHFISAFDRGSEVLITEHGYSPPSLYPAGECSAEGVGRVTCPVQLRDTDAFNVVKMEFFLGAGNDELDLIDLPSLPGLEDNARPNACCGPAYAFVSMGAGGDELISVGPRLVGKLGPGADVAYGGGRGDTLYGGPGPDRLTGGRGNDLLLGEDGGDWLKGALGGDRLHGGAGNDYLHSRDKIKDRITCGLGQRSKQKVWRDPIDRRWSPGVGINC